MLKGNKGEWSEIYVFLKLLAEGKLHAADADLNSIPDIFYPIIKILRREVSGNKDYVINGRIEIFEDGTNVPALIIPTSEFCIQAKKLLHEIKSATGNKLSFPEIEQFLDSIKISSICEPKTQKADIRMVIHDFNTGSRHKLGFSIKSLIGQDATLFNPGAGTNFIYKIEGVPEDFDIQLFNTSTLAWSNIPPKKSKIAARIKGLEALGATIKFHEVQSENLMLNLEIIDSQLPSILSYMLYYKFKNGTSSTVDLLNALNQENPLKFNLSKGHPFYDVKVKAFLTEVALGMTPETVWEGIYDATGGIILVKDSGDLVCYHIYDKNDFQKYLINHTKLDQAATSEDNDRPGHPVVKAPRSKKNVKPYKYGWVYKDGDSYFLKLNLQVRFT